VQCHTWVITKEGVVAVVVDCCVVTGRANNGQSGEKTNSEYRIHCRNEFQLTKLIVEILAVLVLRLYIVGQRWGHLGAYWQYARSGGIINDSLSSRRASIMSQYLPSARDVC